ncbi:MAG: hypothetical protein AAGG81_06480, partial [Chlamydiota bacterium]
MTNLTDCIIAKETIRDTWKPGFKKDKKKYAEKCAESVFQDISWSFLTHVKNPFQHSPTVEKPFSRSYQLSTRWINKVFARCIEEGTIFSQW